MVGLMICALAAVLALGFFVHSLVKNLDLQRKLHVQNVRLEHLKASGPPVTETHWGPPSGLAPPTIVSSKLVGEPKITNEVRGRTEIDASVYALEGGRRVVLRTSDEYMVSVRAEEYVFQGDGEGEWSMTDEVLLDLDDAKMVADLLQRIVDVVENRFDDDPEPL